MNTIDFGPPTKPIQATPTEVVRAEARAWLADRLLILEREGLAFAQ